MTSEPVEGLAPVIPLFGRRSTPTEQHPAAESREAPESSWPASLSEAREPPEPARRTFPPERRGASASARGVTWIDDRERRERRWATPEAEADATPEPAWDATWAEDPAVVLDESEHAAHAEAVLLRKLRARPLSVREAEAVLRAEGVEASGITARFVELGYLDDAALAERLVETGSIRRGQGRAVIARTLAQRGIPRDVADAALAALPDDEPERALAFARSKAGSVGGRDRDAAVRRLAGQLARRGYSSSVALSAARAAVDERIRGR